MKNLLNNLFWQLLNRGFGRVALWVFFLLIPKWIGPAGYGRFSYAFSVSVIVSSILLQSGGELVIIRQIHEDDESILSVFFWLRVLCCTIALFSLTVFAAYHPHLKIYLWLLGYWFFWSIQDLFFACLRSREQMRIEGIVGFSQKLLALLLLVTWGEFKIGMSENLPAIFLCLTTGAGLLAVLLFSPIIREKMLQLVRDVRIRKAKQQRKPVFTEIGILGLITLLTTVHYHIDKVMLGRLPSIQVVGWYALAVRLVEAFLSLPAIIMVVFYPRLTRISKNSRPVALFLFWSLLLSAIVLAFSGRLLGGCIISSIWGQDFAPTAGIFRVLIFSIIPIFPGYLVTQLLVASHKIKAYLYIALVSCIINIILNLLWIPRWTAIGAAWATIVSESCVTIGGVLAYRFMPVDEFGSPGKQRQ